MASRQIQFWGMVLLLLYCGGCRGQPEEDLSIVGIVRTQTGIRESLLRSGLSYPDDQSTVLSGATIYLTYDPKGVERVPGTETQSGPQGTYRIAMNNIPPPHDASGYYWLVIRKGGYEPLLERIKKGATYPYTHNTAVLKPAGR
jgi:hypothetical protein